MILLGHLNSDKAVRIAQAAGCSEDSETTKHETKAGPVYFGGTGSITKMVGLGKPGHFGQARESAKMDWK